MLVANTDATSVATRPPAVLATLMIGVISRFSAPVFSTTPPNAKAAITSQTVGSMLLIPPRVVSVSTTASPVRETYPSASASQTPLINASEIGRVWLASAYAATRSGATITASNPPTSAPMKIVVNGGTFLTAKATTTTSGRKRTRDTWKSRSSVINFSVGSKTPAPPINQKTQRAISNAPAEMPPTWRICVYRLTPLTPAAR